MRCTASNNLSLCAQSSNRGGSNKHTAIVLPCRTSTLGFRPSSSRHLLVSAIMQRKTPSSASSSSSASLALPLSPPSKAAIGATVAKKRLAPRQHPPQHFNTLRTTVSLDSSPSPGSLCDNNNDDQNNGRQVCSYFDFDRDDALAQPGLLLPTLITTTTDNTLIDNDDKKENCYFGTNSIAGSSNHKRFRLPFRPSRPVSFGTTWEDLIPAVPTFESEEDPNERTTAHHCCSAVVDDDDDDDDSCQSPRPRQSSWLSRRGGWEPPAPPSGGARHLIDFDSADLSDHLFLPFSAFD